ncbi:DUF6962 family protein [Mariniplasma anaerobium]|uniref:Uncharacterized protein n=1 Tax=Mariniplasma anaerobium TaxID=2735436 RepID=A0A7U9TGL0_9MOLU|nr:hypothetical protein [Mariniplasma anaerobium]BCR35763.1 hypothetical protein MPAN_006560 [Mariniplasma anaerobium]
MKKRYIIIMVSIVVLLLLFLFPVSLLQTPNLTAFEYLELKPYITIGNIIIIVPSSTLIVYLLGIITIYIGIRLYKLDASYKKYWGISLILWGVGTLLAGTSYQGLGYELKCSGQAFCLFTSWFELSYLYMTALSITMMAYAVAKKSLNEKYMDTYLMVINIGFIVYTISLVFGTIFEIKLWITYEWFLLFFLLYFVSFFVVNFKNNKRNPNTLDKKFVFVWTLMLIINVLYFIYFYSGIPESLYNNYQIWFSANDVLHIGLIYWMYYIYKTVKRNNKDIIK